MHTYVWFALHKFHMWEELEKLETSVGKFHMKKCKKCGDIRLREIPDDTIPQPAWVVDLDAIFDRINLN